MPAIPEDPPKFLAYTITTIIYSIFVFITTALFIKKRHHPLIVARNVILCVVGALCLNMSAIALWSSDAFLSYPCFAQILICTITAPIGICATCLKILKLTYTYSLNKAKSEFGIGSTNDQFSLLAIVKSSPKNETLNKFTKTSWILKHRNWFQDSVMIRFLIKFSVVMVMFTLIFLAFSKDHGYSIQYTFCVISWEWIPTFLIFSTVGIFCVPFFAWILHGIDDTYGIRTGKKNILIFFFVFYFLH